MDPPLAYSLKLNIPVFCIANNTNERIILDYKMTQFSKNYKMSQYTG